MGCHALAFAAVLVANTTWPSMHFLAVATASVPPGLLLTHPSGDHGTAWIGGIGDAHVHRVCANTRWAASANDPSRTRATVASGLIDEVMDGVQP
jgi:hypothetical protein